MIKATIIQDSINHGSRVTTFELDYPRFIHAELMTHRAFSRNAASSRAIPVEMMLKLIQDVPATPSYWGKNQPGMQAKEEVANLDEVEDLWFKAVDNAVNSSRAMFEAGLHKQLANRCTEFAQHMKVVVTATEFENFFQLRDHPDAQPEFAILAKHMRIAMEESEPLPLFPGEWHVPYVDRWFSSTSMVYGPKEKPISLEDARIISASCCAQVSYRKSDDSLEKAKNIFDKLVGSNPKHASPVEHQCSPMSTKYATNTNEWEPGTTHSDRNNALWSGNFKGWTQFRQLL